ncbi:MAG TPA: hypothetical protein DCQ06_06055, partial [Myxococcales bacterium]|nr:hypothetical protein [Myxococcales bacterium]
MLAILYTIIAAVLWFQVMLGGSAKMAAMVTVGPVIGYYALIEPTFFLASCLLVGEWQYKLGGGILQLTFYKLSLLALVARTALDWYVRGSIARPKMWLYTYILVLLSIVLINGALASTTGSVGEVFGLVSYILLGLSCRVLLRTRNDLLNLMTGLSVALLCLGALAFAKSGFSALQVRFFRAEILGADPNEITTMALTWLLIGAPVLLMRDVSRIRKLLAFATFPTFLYLLFITASRGTTISAAIGVGALALALPKRRSSRILGLSAFVLVIITIVAIAPESYRFRMAETVQMSARSERPVINDAHRTELAIESLKLIRERPFFGHGTGMSARHNIKALGRGMTTHSMPLRLAESYGLFTLALIFALLFHGWR